jgi:glycosyltransferase involved in cell wall biosynthesis
VPVIGTDAGGTSEILAKHRGMLYTPGDEEALVEVVQQLAMRPAKQRATSTDPGYEYVQSCRAQHLVPAWNDLLDVLVESRRKA